MAFDFIRAMKSVLATHPEDELNALFTPWAEELIESGRFARGDVLQDYPRPMMRRDSYMNLNGWWEYAIKNIDNDSPIAPPKNFDGPILVPFSPEAVLSGVNRTLNSDEVLWYKRSFDFDAHLGKRVLLNFEAVDYECDCWINGAYVGHHEGGYLPFAFDITDALIKPHCTSTHEVVVRVLDPTNHDVQPRGKQRLDRGSIWYTAQSGIWQTVWIEEVPECYVQDIRLNADLDTGKLQVALTTKSHAPYDSFVSTLIEIRDGGLSKAVESTFESSEKEITLTLELDEVHAWSPEDPHLYDLRIRYGDDAIESYCAFRTCTIENDGNGNPVFCLNHKPYFLRGILDQGYWPDGLMTAPTDEALIYDIEFAKSLDFNMLRKHIKVECRRWYYHCDVLGIMVWQDMINGGGDYSSFHTNEFPTVFPGIASNYDDTKTLERFGSHSVRSQTLWAKEAAGTIELLINHPCICTWVVFNEGWGQFHAKKMTELLRAIDPSRTFDQASGWFDQGGGDFVSEHNYFRDLRVPKNKHRGFGEGRAGVISEFGGAALHIEGHSSLDRAYGYDIFKDPAAYANKVRKTLDTANALEKDGLSGYVYTQLCDVEEEVNGLVTYDRRVEKIYPVAKP